MQTTPKGHLNFSRTKVVHCHHFHFILNEIYVDIDPPHARNIVSGNPPLPLFLKPNPVRKENRIKRKGHIGLKMLFFK